MAATRYKGRLIVHLSLGEKPDPELVGSKAANLHKLVCQELPVPDGFVVTSEAFQFHLEQSGLCRRISRELRELKLSKHQEIERSSDTVQELIRDIPLTSELSKSIEEAYQDPDMGVVAVRSSAVAEDLTEASFAGQYQTCLGIMGTQDLLQAIRDVYASLYSHRALTYAMNKGVDIGISRMAVVVQRMIPAEVSGVMFTRTYVDQDKDDIIIDAVYGLGEGLVSGRLAADHFVVSRETCLIKQRVLARKSEKMVYNPTGGVYSEKVPESLWNRSSLKDQDIRELCSLGLKVEKLFGCPQDIEWALHGNRLYLLQARPVTAPIAEGSSGSLQEYLANERIRLEKKTAGRKVIWSNVAAAEIIPAPTPITLETMKRMGRRDGGVPVAFRKDLGLGGQAGDHAMEMICGRLYWDMEYGADVFIPRWTPIKLKFIENLKKDAQAALPSNTSMDISDWQPAIYLTWRDIFLWPLHLFRIANLVFRFTRTERQFHRKYRSKILPDYLRHINQFRKEDPEDMEDEELIDSISRISHYMCCDPRRWWEVGNILFMTTFEVLSELTRSWFGDDDGTMAAALVRGLDWNKTMEMNIALDRIARESVEDTELAGFLEEYGHRGTPEYELAMPRWREDTSFLKKQIQSVRHKLDTQSMAEIFRQHQMERVELERELMDELRQRPLRRLLWRVVLKDTQTYAPYRETPKHYFLIGYEQLRRRIIEAGRRLARRSILQDQEDVFYLYSWEIESSLLGSMSDSGDVASKRRRERDLGLMVSLPPVIVSHRLDGAFAMPSPENVTELTGLPVSAGCVTGVACVVLDPRQAEHIPDDAILVVPYTDPSWTPLFLSVKALVTDIGSWFSHGSIIAREYGLPAVVNTQTATRVISNGQKIAVDGTAGKVYIGDSLNDKHPQTIRR